MGRRKRKEESSSEESESEYESSESGSDSEESDSEYESYDSEDSSEDDDSGSESETDNDDDDYEQLLNILTRTGLKSAAKKLISNKVFTIKKARTIPSSKLVKKFGIKESEVRLLKKLLNDPSSLVPHDSSSESEFSSDSQSEDEDEQVWKVLRSIDETSLIKLFKRNKLTNLKQAYKLTDKKLRRYGIMNKDRRERIVREFSKKKNNETSSEEDDEIKIAKLMKGIDMKPYIKNLQRGKITDLEAAYSLNSSTLKSFGIASKRDRKKIINAIKQYKKTHAEDDPQLSSMKKALTKLGLRKYYTKLRNKDIDSVKKLKRIDHRDLRQIGVQMYRERREILEKIEKINHDGTVDAGDETEDNISDADKDNVVFDILRQQYMSRHINDFKRANVTGIKEARKLNHTQLRAMGVALYLDREKLIKAFKEHRPKNETILRILVDANLARFSSEFEKLVDLEEARSLSHADLRSMGLNLYGQRDRLIKAFAKHEEDNDSTLSSWPSVTGSKKSRRRKKK